MKRTSLLSTTALLIALPFIGLAHSPLQDAKPAPTKAPMQDAAKIEPMEDKADVTTKVHLGKRKKQTFIGKLNKKIHTHDYTFMAKQGDKLAIDLGGVGDEFVTTFHITSPSGKTFGGKGYDPYDGTLAETGKYVIRVNVNSMASNGDHGKYKLTLSR